MTTFSFAPIGAQSFNVVGSGGLAFLQFSEAAWFATTMPMLDKCKSGLDVVNKAQSAALLLMSIALGCASWGSLSAQNFFTNLATVVLPLCCTVDALFGARFAPPKDPKDEPWPQLGTEAATHGGTQGQAENAERVMGDA